MQDLSGSEFAGLTSDDEPNANSSSKDSRNRGGSRSAFLLHMAHRVRCFRLHELGASMTICACLQCCRWCLLWHRSRWQLRQLRHGASGDGSRRRAAAAAGALPHTQGGNAPLFDGGKAGGSADSRCAMARPPTHHFKTVALANRLRGLAQQRRQAACCAEEEVASA